MNDQVKSVGVGDDEPSTKLYPSWRQAELELLNEGLLVDGTVLPMDLLRERLGLSDPAKMDNGADAIREQGSFNFAMGSLIASLLENHRIKLRCVDGVGYEVVPPDRQTAQSIKDRGAELSCTLSKLVREVSFVRTEQLNDEQRRDNSNAVAKLGALQSLVRRRIDASKRKP